MDKKRILIVEDEQDHIEMLKMRLESVGYDVATASRGEDGGAKAQELKPDLILLDIIMPDIDGVEVLRRLRANPDTHGLKVICITASGLIDIEERCAKAGANDCFRKPYDVEKLLEAIKSLVK